MPKAMTEEIKKRLRDELNTLERELSHDIPRELKKAVAMGDLSENAEYHRDKVGLGSTVTIYDGTKNEEMEYQLVTSEESDVAAGKISTTSPIGRALLNKKVGDIAMVVTPGGSREMEILKLSTMHDLAEAKLEAELEALPEPERETE
jgi:transcription elongation factor GreA